MGAVWLLGVVGEESGGVSNHHVLHSFHVFNGAISCWRNEGLAYLQRSPQFRPQNRSLAHTVCFGTYSVPWRRLELSAILQFTHKYLAKGYSKGKGKVLFSLCGGSKPIKRLTRNRNPLSHSMCARRQTTIV